MATENEHDASTDETLLATSFNMAQDVQDLDRTNLQVKIAANFVVGDDDCRIRDICDVLSPENSAKLIRLWSTLADALGENLAYIQFSREKLSTGHKNYTDIYTEILTNWVGEHSRDATLKALIDILRAKGCDDEAGALSKKYFGNDNRPQGRPRECCTLLVILLLVSIEIAIFVLTKMEGPEFRSTLPAIPSYYIERYLQSRSVMDNFKLFRMDSENDVLVFNGANWQQIKGCVPLKKVQTIDDAIVHGINSSYIADITEMSDFEILCKKSQNKSVHWIRYNAENYSWVRTCGSINFISKMVDTNVSVTSENSILRLIQYRNHTATIKTWDNVFNNSLVIVGERGVGKLTLLASIGNKTNELYPNVIVVFSDMSKFITKIKRISSYSISLKQAIINVVSNIKCFNNRCKTKITGGFRLSSNKLLILLDGFDHVSKTDMELGIEILNELKRFNSTFVIVTSQSYLLDFLESKLTTIAYRLQPFDEVSQTKFLVNYWQSSYKSTLNATLLNEYAKDVISFLIDRLTKTEKEFTGIALQTVLIAEVYNDNATQYADEDNRMNQSPAVSPPVFIDTSIHTLFTYMIDKKINLTIKKSSDKFDKISIYYYLSYRAIEYKFPQISFSTINTLDNKTIEQVGLLVRYDETDNLRFIHSSFMDYFVSWYLINCEPHYIDLCGAISIAIFEIDTSSFELNGNIKCSLCSVSYLYRERLCLYFLDRDPNLIKLTSYLDISSINKTPTLLAAVQHNFLAIFEFLKTNVDESNYELMFMSAVLYSSDTYTLQQIFSTYNYARNKTLSEIETGQCSYNGLYLAHNFSITLLHLSIIRGDEYIIRYLLQMQPLDSWGKYYLHLCVSSLAGRTDLLGHPNNITFDTQLVFQRKVLIDLFLNESISLLEEHDLEREICSPLFSSVSYDNMIYLLNKGASPSTNCLPKFKFLQIAIINLSSANFDNIIAYLNTTNKLTPLLEDSGDGLDAVYMAISKMNPSITTLKLFKDNGVNFKLRKGLSRTPLAAAIDSMKPPEYLRQVMKYQTNWRGTSKYDMSALTYSSIRNNTGAFDLFLKLSPKDVDSRDHENKTALYYVSECGQRRHITYIVNKLLSHNANPQKHFGQYQVTPVLKAAQIGPLYLTKLLVNTCKPNCKTDVQNNTALHYAVQYLYDGSYTCGFSFPPPDQDLIVKFLIYNSNFNVNSKNARNLTALEVSISEDTPFPMLLLPSMKIFIESGAKLNDNTRFMCLRHAMRCPVSGLKSLQELEYITFVNAIGAKNLTRRDKYGNTLLHVATRETCLYGVKYLVRNQLDVNLLDSAGHTALYYMKSENLTEASLVIYKYLQSNGAHA